MRDDVRPRVYRMAPNRKRAFLVVIGVGTLAMLGVVLPADDLPGTWRFGFLFVWAALMGWLFYATLRCSTSFDIKALYARGMVRGRRLAWEDIQDIRAEPNPAAAMQRGAAEVLVHAYGRDGSKVLLPFVDDLHVNVERELGLLRTTWTELRGEDWAPDPQAAVTIERRDARQAALMLGFGVTMMATLPLTVLMLLPLFVDMPGWLESTLSPLTVMGLGLPLVFLLTAVLSYRARLRR
ncbi:hypothetical protein ACIPSE_28675 [Streptomyces sp. NPDC090106]|uniref:hypothetical protein n=1 Tax=Streptomyces sp. NPDC090106 TaxID=3365946 RepID=UPI003826CF8C